MRPYEMNPGEVDLAAAEVIADIERKIEERCDLREHIAGALDRISSVRTAPVKKPLVGIVGEIYVRSNSFCNNYLIRYIEKCGGEAWLAPISEWFTYTAWFERYIAGISGKNIFSRIIVNQKTAWLLNRLHVYEELAEKYLHDRREPDIEDVLGEGARHLPVRFEGESILTVGRAVKFIEAGASLVVNCSPFGCMPGNITSSIFKSIQGMYNVPVISLFYDGESDINRIVGIYLDNIKKAGAVERQSATDTF
jgi:predicted nucleotide-binding protein (sugar kinase/HSP70/actin superfamily)